jgi:hypothetical protein
MEGEIKADRNPGGPGTKGQKLDALCSGQADMERSSTGLNQILDVVPHK